jgi:hypothetical protein
MLAKWKRRRWRTVAGVADAGPRSATAATMINGSQSRGHSSICIDNHRRMLQGNSKVSFVFIFLFEFVLHAKLLHNAYTETSTLWRTEEGFSSHFPLLLLGQAIIAFFFTMIFASGFGGGGPGAGIKFGIMFAFVGVGANLIQFAVQPLTTKILVAWSVGGLIEFAIVGAIVGAIYKPSPSV